MVEALGTPWQGAEGCVSGSLEAGEILGRVLDGENAEMIQSEGFSAPWIHTLVLVVLVGMRRAPAWKSLHI